MFLNIFVNVLFWHALKHVLFLNERYAMHMLLNERYAMKFKLNLLEAK